MSVSNFTEFSFIFCMKYFHLLESIIACFKDMRLDEAASETTGHKLFVGLNWNSNLKYPLKWNYDGNLLAYMYGNENQICSCSTFRLSIRKHIDDFILSRQIRMTVVDFKARYIAHNFILTKQGQSYACFTW